MVSIVVGYYHLEETHPERKASPAAYIDAATAETPLLATAGATEHCGVDLRAESYGTFNTVDMTEQDSWAVSADGSPLTTRDTDEAFPQRTFTRRVVMLTVALGIFTYHSMTYDHLLPIFLQDDRVVDLFASAGHASVFDLPGGLGLSLQAVGLIMSVNGVIAMVIQGLVFPVFASWLGVWRVFLLVTLLHPIAYFVVPYLALLPADWLYSGIYLALTIRNFLSILAYPVILILLKEATPSHSVLGKVNGLAASAGAACRTIAPPLAGYLYGVGSRHGFTGLAWWGSGLVAMIGAGQCWFVEREKYRTTHVQCVAAAFSGEPHAAPKNEVVHITVNEVGEAADEV